MRGAGQKNVPAGIKKCSPRLHMNRLSLTQGNNARRRCGLMETSPSRDMLANEFAVGRTCDSFAEGLTISKFSRDCPQPMKAACAMYAAIRHFNWLCGGLLIARLTSPAADWTQYRGPNHNGTSADRINKQWSGSITNPVWLVPVTNGPCSLTVSGGRIFTQIRRTIDGFDKEVCVALSTADGAELWATTVDDAIYDGGVGFDDG